MPQPAHPLRRVRRLCPCALLLLALFCTTAGMLTHARSASAQTPGPTPTPFLSALQQAVPVRTPVAPAPRATPTRRPAAPATVRATPTQRATATATEPATATPTAHPTRRPTATLRAAATPRAAATAVPTRLAPSIPPLPVAPILPLLHPSPTATLAPTATPHAVSYLPLPTSPAPAQPTSALAGPADPSASATPAEKVVYLTFDDGPFPPYTQQMLDVLAEFDAHATFFVLGRQAVAEPDTIRKIYEGGHAVGNHSWSHSSLSGMGWQSFKAEVDDTGALLGGYNSNCLRPPYGYTDGNTANYARDLGYTLALWNVDPQDWRLPGAAVIANRVLAVVKPGSVVLLHDGGGDRSQTVGAVRIILDRLTAQGYSFKAVCRDVPMPDVYGTPKPDDTPRLPELQVAEAPAAIPTKPADGDAPADGGAPADGDVIAAGAESAEAGGKLLAQPAPAVTSHGAILQPGSGDTVSGIVDVVGYAQSDSLSKWQLDLLVGDAEEVFLTLGETPLDEPDTLYSWDTTTFPNGVHMLRLRVVHQDMNYDEYFAHVTVRN